MKKWMFQITVGNIMLILFGTILNLLGRWVAGSLSLPIWLDSVGTFISAVLLGPVAGAISGALMNVVVGMKEQHQIWFAMVSIAGGLAVGRFFPRDRKIDSFSVIATALFAGFLMTVVSTPLNLYFYDGYVGNPWGDALVDMMSEYVRWKTICCISGGLLVNMPDKALSIVIAMVILYRAQKKVEKGNTLKCLLLWGTVTGSLAALAACGRAYAASDFQSDYMAVVYGLDSGLVSAEINTVAQTSDGYIWAGAYSGLYRYNGSVFEQVQLDERINNVMYLYVDSKGRLWIGTNDGGVACYQTESGSITFYTMEEGLPSDSIRSICEDGDGNIYVSTTAELCRIDKKGKVRVFTEYPEIDCVYSLNRMEDGCITGVTWNGMLFFMNDGELVSSFFSETEAVYTAVACEAGGKLMVGTAAGDLLRFRIKEDGSLVSLDTMRVPELGSVNYLLYASKEDGYFVGAANGAAFVENGESVTLLRREKFGSAVTGVMADYQDNIWFSSSKQGIMKLSRNPFTNQFRKAGISEAVVNALLIREDTLYVGTDTGLTLIRLGGGKTEGVKASDSGGEQLDKIEDGAELEASEKTTDGIGVKNEREINDSGQETDSGNPADSAGEKTGTGEQSDSTGKKTGIGEQPDSTGKKTGNEASGDNAEGKNETEGEERENGEPSDSLTEYFRNVRIRHLMEDENGNIWVSTYGPEGLVCILPSGEIRSFQNVEGILGSRFRFTLALADGSILAASTEGLSFIQNGKVTGTVGVEDGLQVPQILSAVQREDGTILAGSDGGGIYLIRDGAVTGHMGTEEGFQSLVILKIVPCGEQYLYVTSNGLYCDSDEGKVRRLEAFPYNNDYDIYLPGDGNAWVSSSAGIYVVRLEKLLEDKEYQYVLLNHTRGFDTTLSANAWNAEAGGRLYFCCTDGVRSIETQHFHDGNDAYSIVLHSFTDEGQEIPMENGVYQIPSGKGRLQVLPAVLDYTVNNPLVSVTLEGSDEPEVFMHQTEMRELHYMSLPFGDYTLRVRVVDELTGEVRKEQSFALHKDAVLYEHLYYKLYLVFVCVMWIAFLAWTVSKMSSMAVINRQYEQIREAKEEAELANQAKSRFLANMSHEIRTPINAVLGMDEMILRESREPEIRGYASDIYTAGTTLLSLINDILDSSKIESGKMEIVEQEYELAVLIRDLVNMISKRAADKELALVLEADPELPSVLFGDDVRLRQVLTNILTNAVKYTPAGTVWLRVSGQAEGEEVLLHFEVEDTGIGIKEEDLPKLFEAYQRIEEGRNRHIEGTGLGMNITLQLLAMMGSRLQVESVYGKGSRFYFDLRQKIREAAPMGDPAGQQGRQEAYRYEGGFCAPDARVLVVDDNAMNRKVFRSLLKVTGIQVEEASGGAEALSMAETSRYDMVFMDHMMPGMDGVETMQHMRKLDGYDRIPIYVLTANAVTGAKEQYLESGFDGFLSKPIVSAKLEQALREALPQELLKPVEMSPVEQAGDAGVHLPNRETMTHNSENAGQSHGNDPDELPAIDGLDWNYACLHLPDPELLKSAVRDFYEMLDHQADKLQKLWEEQNMEAYRILVHSMKSSAATIGIVPLAGMAKMLEHAARDGERETLDRMHGVFLKEWRSYQEKLRGVFGLGEQTEEEGEMADREMLLAICSMLRQALEDFDVDACDSLVERLRSYRYESELQEKISALSAAVRDLDEEEAVRLMDEILNV